jgi:predicted nucleic acid-binding protein
MYLVDTNVWLERLLDQEHSVEVGQFLSRIPAEQLSISDFSLHSIGIILCRLDRCAAWLKLVDDLFVNGRVSLVSVQPEAMRRLVEVTDQFNLDFDDAYQYVVAELAAAEMVSFDGDFDRTDRGRRTPTDILSAIAKSKDNG